MATNKKKAKPVSKKPAVKAATKKAAIKKSAKAAPSKTVGSIDCIFIFGINKNLCIVPCTLPYIIITAC